MNGVSVKKGLTVWSNPVCTDIEGGGGGIKKKCPYERGVRIKRVSVKQGLIVWSNPTVRTLRKGGRGGGGGGIKSVCINLMFILSGLHFKKM